MWRRRPAGGAGTGADVAFQRYETVNAYVAGYAEVTVDRTSGQVRVSRVVVPHDCGLIITSDGLRNQILGGAIGNAVYAATGVRIRTLPFTPARVLAAMNA